MVGFDNTPESALSTPALSTINQPIQEMGQRAVALLVQLLAGEQPDAMHITLETRLVVRQSSTPPAEGGDPA